MIDSLATPWTVAHQASLSMRFPRQEYWSGLPSPSSGDLPNQGVKPMSPELAGGFFTTESSGSPIYSHTSQEIPIQTPIIGKSVCHFWQVI